nr:hypothetical protein [Actinomyces naeslundii]
MPDQGLPLCHLTLQPRHLPLHTAQLTAYPALLTLEDVKRNGVGVVSLEELVSLPFEPSPHGLRFRQPLSRLCYQHGHLPLQGGFEDSSLPRPQRHSVVEPDDLILNLLRQRCPKQALRLLLGVPPQADEVLIHHTAGLHIRHDETGTTDPAVDRRLQVVRVLDRPLTVDAGGQQRLHRLVRRPIHQGLMAPGIVHPLVDHLTDVEGIVEHLAE